MQQNQQKEVTEHIWRELSDRLRQFVRSRITSEADVDDVVQTVLLRIHSRLDSLRGIDRLESWVFQITRNAITDHFRGKRNVQNDVDSLSVASENEDDVMNELAGCLTTLIERLPDDQRRALSMYEIEGVSQKDIAIRESISVSGAKSRVQRGRKTLEKILKACCEFQFDGRGNVVGYESSDTDCCKGE